MTSSPRVRRTHFSSDQGGLERDEYQRRLDDEAFAHAYAILAFLLLLAIVAAPLAERLGIALVRPAPPLLLSLLVALACLPAACREFAHPTPLLEEDEEEEEVGG